MNKFLYSLLLLIVAGTLTFAHFFTHDSLQAKKPITASIANLEPTSLDGEVVGVLKPSSLTAKDRKTSFVNHPPPSVHLVFRVTSAKTTKDSRTIRPISVYLSTPANRDLGALWKATLDYLYRSKVEHGSDWQTRFDEDRAMLKMIIMTEEKLQTRKIRAPEGQRNLSKTEAERLTGFFRISAENLIGELIRNDATARARKIS